MRLDGWSGRARPDNRVPSERLATLEAAAHLLGRKTLVLLARTNSEIDVAIATRVEQRIDALVISSNALFNNRSEQLGELSFRYGLAAISQFREFTIVGGLMSYGTSLPERFASLAATLVGFLRV